MLSYKSEECVRV